MKTQTRHSLMLMLCAFIRICGFRGPSAGSGMGPVPSSQGAAGWLSSFDPYREQLSTPCTAKTEASPTAGRNRSERPCWRRALSAAPSCSRPLRLQPDRHHHQRPRPRPRSDGHVRCAGAGVRPLSWAGRAANSALGQHGHRRGGPVYALMKNSFDGIETSDWILLKLLKCCSASDHVHRPLFAACGRCAAGEPHPVHRGGCVEALRSVFDLRDAPRWQMQRKPSARGPACGVHIQRHELRFRSWARRAEPRHRQPCHVFGSVFSALGG